MAWNASRPPPDLAREYALEAILIEALPALVRTIQNNQDTQYLLDLGQPGYGPLDISCVDIGDLELMPPLDPNGWLQLRVEGAGHRGGMDVGSKNAYINTGGEDTFHTSVFGYLHNDAFRNTEHKLQSRQREVTLRLVAGWLRGRVLNYIGPLESGVVVTRRILKLKSQERFDDGIIDPNTGIQQTDYLSDCIATEGHSGYFVRQYSSEILYGVEFKHSGVLRG